jgi:hypothetical protein
MKIEDEEENEDEDDFLVSLHPAIPPSNHPAIR